MSPRVLLVDDDAAIRRFVAMVLEDLGIALLTAAGVEEAIVMLRADGPVQLLLTDLMMPGTSGLDLLALLASEPALRGDARLVVMSAGLDAGTLARLGALDVWRALRKPASVAELKACVSEALLDGTPAPVASPLAVTRPAAVERYFGGDQGLFEAFQQASLAQFAEDLSSGDAAMAQFDAPALRRLAHSLKSVLAMLGEDSHAAAARQLEERAAASDWPAAGPLWQQVRDVLVRLRPEK